MKRAITERNIRLYYWHVGLREPLFWGPILIISIQEFGGMSLSEVYFMESIVLIYTMLAEVMTGSWADTIGRKKVVVIGSVTEVIGMLCFALANSTVDIWIANILFMTGLVLCSGADDALIYDSLRSAGREGEYMKVKGLANSNKLLLVGICSLFVGFLAEIHMRLPLLLSVPPMLVSVIQVARIQEAERKQTKYSAKRQWSIAKLAILLIANHKPLKWIVVFSALICVSSKLWFFTYNPYFEIVSLDIKMYGVMFFLLNMVAWGFSRYAHVVEGKLGEGKTFIVMVLCVGVPILCMGMFVAVVSVSMILFQNIVRGISGPFFSSYINRHIASEERATVISASSAFNAVCQFFALGGFGYLLTLFSVPSMLTMLGIAVLVLGTLGVLQYYKMT